MEINKGMSELWTDHMRRIEGKGVRLIGFALEENLIINKINKMNRPRIRIFVIGQSKCGTQKEKFEKWQLGMDLKDISMPHGYQPKYGDLIRKRKKNKKDRGHKTIMLAAEFNFRWNLLEYKVKNNW